MSLKIGFIGVGGIAGGHLSKLSGMKDVEIKSLCDVVSEKAESSGKEYGASAYTDYRQMLDKEKLDAVFICVPPFAHGDIEIEAAERNLPFFVEKPVNLYMEKAREVDNLVKKKNLITSVGYCLRYMKIVEKAKEILKRKTIAQIIGRYFGQVPGAGKGWYAQREKSGGQIVEQATHIVDLMRYFAGDVDSVYGQGFKGINKIENYDVEDASIVNMHFKSGCIGSVSCNWLLWGYEPSMEIVTSCLRMKYSISSLEVIEKNKKEEFLEESDFVLDQDRIFIEAVKNGDASGIKSDYHDGLKTLKVTLDANRSIEKGEVIKF